MKNSLMATLSTLIFPFSFLANKTKEEKKEKKEIEPEFFSEDGILILNQFNFKEALKRHELLMVKFYLPWCSYCKTFAPEYLKLGQILESQQSKIKLGKYDATSNEPVIQQQGIVSFPALRLFKHGQPITYTGKRKAENIVAWLQRNS